MESRALPTPPSDRGGKLAPLDDKGDKKKRKNKKKKQGDVEEGIDDGDDLDNDDVSNIEGDTNGNYEETIE